MKYFKKLVGDNIYLSPRNVEDAEIFTEWMNDFETTDYIGRSHQLMTVDAERRFLEKHMDDECSFAIVELENGPVPNFQQYRFKIDMSQIH